MTKHVFITGGVVSSLGKGLTAASLAFLLKRRGYRVRMQKLDPYLNVDPGTMSPFQHGEVYVTADGAETDLDIGHYERFTGINCSRAGNYTSGRIYNAVIARERAGGYLGETVQVIPHVTDEIKNAILSMDDDDADLVITEIGGTAGDIESHPFLEAIRQLRQELGGANAIFIHVTLVPFLKAAGEMKTKPAQQSAGVLRAIGIIPDILICRCEQPLTREQKHKLSMFCNVDKDLVIDEIDVEHSIYEVPLYLAEQDVDVYILEKLNLHVHSLDVSDWKNMVARLITHSAGEVEIAMVGKYTDLRDAYKSVYEALAHGGLANDVKVRIKAVDSEEIERRGCSGQLEGVHGVLVPGGFGKRGVQGKIEAIRYAREQKIPFFGICLGMQCAVVEFARNVCEMAGAGSAEFDDDPQCPVIDLMPEQKGVTQKGGTMRLGAYPCVLDDDSNAARAYGQKQVFERHRHRYEFNNMFKQRLVERGFVCSGWSPDGRLAEIVEIRDHPWFVACQFHPEFQSRPLDPHPLFRDFIAHSIAFRDKASGMGGRSMLKKGPG